MKVLLITPTIYKFREKWMPLSLCYIAAKLREHGHEVRLFDRYFHYMSNNREALNDLMLKEVIRFSPDIIGFSTNSPSIFDTYESIKIIAPHYNNKIVLGGHHVTEFPKLTLKRMPRVDAVITGEGEIPLSMYADGKPCSEIPGLYWREGDTIKSSGMVANVTDLDAFPMPSYDLLNMDFYTEKNIYTIRPFYLSIGSILTSRGCNNRCTFCCESSTFPRGVRYHSIDYVIGNIELLINEYGCKGIAIVDNNFLADRTHCTAILNRIIEKGLNSKAIFGIQARASDLDDELGKLLNQANFKKIEFGFESNNSQTLKSIEKNISLDIAQQAIKICKKHKISIQANLIMGFENETIETLESTLGWLKSIKVDNFRWNQLMLYPGSQLYREYGKSFYEDNEWTKENITHFHKIDHITNISHEDRERWLKKRLSPFTRYNHHKGIISVNNIKDIIEHYTIRLNEKRKSK